MGTDQPEISVCICTYNRDDFLKAALDSLAEQGLLKGKYEILMIDNNSTDRTPEIAREFGNEHPDLNFRYFIEKNQGLSHARNRGITEARSPVIAFIDDDAIASYDYLSSLVKLFRDHPGAIAAGGKILPYYPDGDEPGWLSKYMLGLISCLDMGNKLKEFGKKYPIGCNMAFRQEAFDKAGMFNVHLGRIEKELGGSEEKDMFQRLKPLGQPIYYVPEALVYHTIPKARLTRDYIRNLSSGIGRSERLLFRHSSLSGKFRILLIQAMKTAGTWIIGASYYARGEKDKGRMLFQYRNWFFNGFLS